MTTSRLAIVLALVAGCGSPPSGAPPGDTQVVSVLDGETVITTRTAAGAHTDVFSLNGALVYSTELAANAKPHNYVFFAPGDQHPDGYDLDVDPIGVPLEPLNYAAFLLFHDAQDTANGKSNFDNHGCDHFPLAFSCKQFGGCCDVHDACFHQYDCNQYSVFIPLVKQNRACKTICNRNVIQCFVDVITNKNPPPPEAGPSSCCYNGQPLTCGEPWCYNDPALPVPCTAGQCCGAGGLCQPAGSGCGSGTACIPGNDIDCASGTCTPVCIKGDCTKGGMCTGTPLDITASSTTFDCSGPGVTLTATGGVPPYTFSADVGTITATGSDTALLTAPPNPGAFQPGAAYSVWDGSNPTFTCSGGHSTCNFGWACIGGPGAPLRFYDCSGTFTGGRDCGGAFDCVGFGPMCPVADCNALELPKVAADCGPAGTPRDLRSAAQLASGCNPCVLSMAGGSNVSVTDSAGTTVGLKILP
jgi:hypothetical protein